VCSSDLKEVKKKLILSYSLRNLVDVQTVCHSIKNFVVGRFVIIEFFVSSLLHHFSFFENHYVFSINNLRNTMRNNDYCPVLFNSINNLFDLLCDNRIKTY